LDINTILQNTVQQIKAHGVRATLHSLLRRAQVRWAEWYYNIHTDKVIDLPAPGISNDGY
jgi:hypothetical protein